MDRYVLADAAKFVGKVAAAALIGTVVRHCTIKLIRKAEAWSESEKKETKS